MQLLGLPKSLNNLTKGLDPAFCDLRFTMSQDCNQGAHLNAFNVRLLTIYMIRHKSSSAPRNLSQSLRSR